MENPPNRPEGTAEYSELRNRAIVVLGEAATLAETIRVRSKESGRFIQADAIAKSKSQVQMIRVNLDHERIYDELQEFFRKQKPRWLKRILGGLYEH